jgi:hypothetical protein
MRIRFLAVALACLALLITPTESQTANTASVTLMWTPSTTAGATYNVYQETSSGACTATTTGAGPGCLRLNATPVTTAPNAAGQITYNLTAQFGSTWYYVVRAVNSAGIESANSNEVSLNLTAPTAPQLTCSVVLNLTSGSSASVTCK